MKHIYMQLLEILQSAPPVALATVTGTVGSTPRKCGASAIISSTGLLSGTIGGGVTEIKVRHIVQSALLSKKSGHYCFTLDKDIHCTDEAICGGQMDILVDAAPGIHQAVFEQLRQSLKEGIPGVLVTKVLTKQDQQVEITRFWITEEIKSSLHGAFHELDVLINRMLAVVKQGDYEKFSPPRYSQDAVFLLETVLPPPRLVIAGAGHIGKALAHLGNLLDFEVTVIDDRSEYANDINIPDADHLVVDEMGPAMQKLKKTPDTYIVIVTRGHACDADALKPCMGSGAAYIGMIGSIRKTAMMRQQFIDEKWATPKQWDEIHAPIGLPIHAESVQEIALSIAAQLVLAKNRNIREYA